MKNEQDMGGSWHTCNVCLLKGVDVGFPNRSKLGRHMRVHNPYRTQYKCCQCVYSATTAYNLKAHQARRHGISFTKGMFVKQLEAFQSRQNKINSRKRKNKDPAGSSSSRTKPSSKAAKKSQPPKQKRPKHSAPTQPNSVIAQRETQTPPGNAVTPSPFLGSPRVLPTSGRVTTKTPHSFETSLLNTNAGRLLTSFQHFNPPPLPEPTELDSLVSRALLQLPATAERFLPSTTSTQEYVPSKVQGYFNSLIDKVRREGEEDGEDDNATGFQETSFNQPSPLGPAKLRNPAGPSPLRPDIQPDMQPNLGIQGILEVVQEMVKDLRSQILYPYSNLSTEQLLLMAADNKNTLLGNLRASALTSDLNSSTDLTLTSSIARFGFRCPSSSDDQ